jgi:tRNA threonylcarbamoyl adenosine modification protein (Sua5/YciO/YrdC/YwlC family)
MIYYIVEENPDDRIVQKAVANLLEDKIIVFPTDTSWVLGADLFSKKAVEKLYQLKNYERKRHLSLLCHSISQVGLYAVVSDFTYKKIRRLIPGPYTFIFPPTRSLPHTIKDYKKDRQIGVRIPDSVLCRQLVERLGHPLLTSSINLAQIYPDTPQEDYPEGPILGHQIEDAFGSGISMILDPGELHLPGPSTVVDFSEEGGPPKILRYGVGDVTPFILA